MTTTEHRGIPVIPAEELITKVDYADRFVIDLPYAMDAPTFCTHILESAPGWLDGVLTARDLVAGRLGFHTQERNYGQQVALEVGGKFGPLVVRALSPERVVCGDVDRHLAFRATFETTRGDLPRGSFTTEVECRDRLGRAYFGVVRPFHRRLIPALVARPFPGRAFAAPVPDTAP